MADDFQRLDDGQENPLVFDPSTRRYLPMDANPALELPKYQPVTQSAAMTAPARSFAPTPEQLDQQRDLWFARVSPMAAMGNRRAQAAIEAADRAMIREKVSQGMTYAQALMETRMHSGLPVTLAEESLARQVTPAKPWKFVPGSGETPGAFMAEGQRPVVVRPTKPTTEKTVSITQLQTERNQLLKEAKEADEKKKAEIISQVQGIQERINSMAGITPGTAVPEVTPAQPGLLGTSFLAKPAVTNWVAGKAMAPVPATGTKKINEVVRVLKDGRKAVFNADTKQFLRYAE